MVPPSIRSTRDMSKSSFCPRPTPDTAMPFAPPSDRDSRWKLTLSALERIAGAGWAAAAAAGSRPASRPTATSRMQARRTVTQPNGREGSNPQRRRSIDPVGLTRRGGRSPSAFAEYVNDRPYVASPLMSVALVTVFKTAMEGKAPERALRPGRREALLGSTRLKSRS